MSDWEAFCEAMGANHGSSEDYDRMIALLPGVPSLNRYRVAEDYTEGESTAHRFETFQEAATWAKSGKGRVFTRSTDGKYFVPKEPVSGVAKTASAILRPKTEKRVQWPSHEPNISGWIPGSYPTTDEEQGFADKDFKEVCDFFYRTIERLAPSVWRSWHYKNRHPFSITGLSGKLLCRRKTNVELLELLAAFEWRLVRSNQLKTSKEQKKLKYKGDIHSVVFYEEAITIILAELSRRGDAVIREVQEELSLSDLRTAAESKSDGTATVRNRHIADVPRAASQ